MADEWQKVPYKTKRVKERKAPAETNKPHTPSMYGPIQEQPVVRRATGHRPAYTNNAAKIEQNAEEGNLHVEKVSMNLRQQIMKARQSKGMTQKQLDAACQFKSGTVQRYENGAARPDNAELQKMRRVLGVSLKK